MIQPETAFVSHLIELRTRLLWIVAVLMAVFVPLAMMANNLFAVLAGPLIALMPAGTSMIATEVAAPFLTPFKLALVTAFFISVPYILWQIWSFVAPGLYQQEKRLVVPLMGSSVVLFYLGALFAYFVVLPIFFRFMIGIAPEGVEVMTDISRYLDFILMLFIAFGVAFEVPIVIILLVWSGVTTPASLTEKRAYVLIGAFVVGMFLTPPDVISQTLLAVPVYLLYELGIIFSRVLIPGHREVEAQNIHPDQ